jgi:hypothetical protein
MPRWTKSNGENVARRDGYARLLAESAAPSGEHVSRTSARCGPTRMLLNGILAAPCEDSDVSQILLMQNPWTIA